VPMNMTIIVYYSECQSIWTEFLSSN